MQIGTHAFAGLVGPVHDNIVLPWMSGTRGYSYWPKLTLPLAIQAAWAGQYACLFNV
jgi:hypothetical protein